MKRRSWLIFAILLIAAATALMIYAEEPQPEAEPTAEVTFPRQFDDKHSKRMRARRTLPAPAPVPTEETTEQTETAPRDPVLAAIASGAKSAVVIEANALRHSPIGELLLECMLARNRKNPIEELRNRAGIDPLQDLDRVAMTEHGVVFSGNFQNARVQQLFGDQAQSSSYGDQATFYQRPPRANGGANPGVFVSWGGQMLMFAEDEAQARAAVDRLEGRAESTPILTEEQSYGEIYGVFSADDLARILPPEQAELAQRFREAADRVELHVDASHDVGIVANVQGADPASVDDLGRSVGGLLSAARLRAMAEGEDELVEFLDLARVRPRDGRFGLEVGLPLELLKQRLAFCKEENERRRDAEENGTAATPAVPAETATP